jgi:hypothetical protein
MRSVNSGVLPSGKLPERKLSVAVDPLVENSMSDDPLPRGRGGSHATPVKSLRKSRLFGLKNKRYQEKKHKKFAPKMKYAIKAKDYAQGCIALGCVRSVEDDIIYVDLLGDVRGVLLLTEINDHFLERLRTAVDKQSPTLPCLGDLFSFRDFITAVVLSNGTQPVELSIRPQLLNVGIPVKEDQVFMGAVKSKVDRGFLVDLGHASIEGFLPNPIDAKIGQPFYVRIIAISSPTLVRLEPYQPETFFPSVSMQKIHFDALRPYVVAKATVAEITPSGGLKVQVAKVFHAACGRFAWIGGISEGIEVLSRPVLIDPSQKVFWVTLVDSVVAGRRPSCFDATLGSIVDVEVNSIMPDVAVECHYEDFRVVIDLRKGLETTALVAGDTHSVRLVERRPLDDLLLATDDPSIMGLPIFCADDVVVGSLVSGHSRLPLFALSLCGRGRGHLRCPLP